MARSRRNILDAAHQRVAEGGFGAATVAAVAARAGVATGTVYRYFPSKADLLTEVFREASGREVEVMREQAAGKGSPRRRLEAAIATFARRAIRGRRLAWALIAEPVDPAIDAERLVYRRAYAGVLSSLLREGIGSREFRAQDVWVSAASLVGALAEALIGPLAPDADALEDEGAALVLSMVDFCLHAVSQQVPDAHT